MARLRHGNPRRGLTLEETALALQKEEGAAKPLSRERIRQIEKQGLKKLKRLLDERGLTYEDLMPNKMAEDAYNVLDESQDESR